jgi:UDP-N-acetylglucosamine 4,6-dehydratase/5-epimerase
MTTPSTFKYYHKKTVLITGGTGSWGTELTKQLLAYCQPAEIRIYSRGEFAQVRMRRQLNDDPRLKFIIGDVRDYERLKTACEGVDCLFHLAALKHVPVCEDNPFEAVKTNILGTQHIIDAAIQQGVDWVVDVSSDKAVDPLNLYGTTKSVGEKLIIAANTLTRKTSFVCFRAGNVLGTNGSVVPLFRSQILQKNALTLTNPDMTRFFENLNVIIAKLLQVLGQARRGETFTLNMPALRIGDLAQVMTQELGNTSTRRLSIGVRPGEKTHEILISKEELSRTTRVGQDFFIIHPVIKIPGLKSRPSMAKPLPFKQFSSDQVNLLSLNEIKSLLNNEQWLTRSTHPSDHLLRQDPDSLLNPFRKEGWQS